MAESEVTAAVVGAETHSETTDTGTGKPTSIDALVANLPSEEAEAPPAEPEKEKEPPKKEPEPKAETTPDFDPAKYGLGEEYAGCKNLEEALALANRRHKEAERKIQEQGDELGKLRKGAEKPEPGPAKPPEMTQEQVTKWREEFQRLIDEEPETVVRAIQEPVIAKIAALEARIAEIDKTAKEAKELPLKMREQQGLQVADREFNAFVEATPEADKYLKNGAMHEVGEAVNGTKDLTKWTRCDFKELFELAKMRESDKPTYEGVLKFVKGGFTLDEAKGYVEATAKKAVFDKAEKERLAEETKKKAKLAGVGSGGASPRPAAKQARSIAQLVEQLPPP